MSKKRKPFDVRAVNPRYRNAKMSDVARALMRPKDPKVRRVLERLWKESAKAKKRTAHERRVKPSV